MASLVCLASMATAAARPCSVRSGSNAFLGRKLEGKANALMRAGARNKHVVASIKSTETSLLSKIREICHEQFG